jgi:hypothetical protein
LAKVPLVAPSTLALVQFDQVSGCSVVHYLYEMMQYADEDLARRPPI